MIKIKFHYKDITFPWELALALTTPAPSKAEAGSSLPGELLETTCTSLREGGGMLERVEAATFAPDEQRHFRLDGGGGLRDLDLTPRRGGDSTT